MTFDAMSASGVMTKILEILRHTSLVNVGVHGVRTVDHSIVASLQEFQYSVVYAGKRQLLFRGELLERKRSFSKYHFRPSAIVALRG